MEIFRALAALVEPPRPELQPVAGAVGLGPLPEMAEHSDLFAFQLYPYASVYLGEEGMLGGEARDRVAGFWRALGLDPPAEPDHLTVLLAFYAGLAGEDEGEDPGARRDRARVAFLWEHLLSWLPVYLARLAVLASPFYRQWGELLTDALVQEVRRAELPGVAPLALREVAALADPRVEGAKSFVASLLSPARCGFILVRDDLVRAAHELELGRRVGERRFVLEGLFSQAAEPTLDWLRGFAAEQAAAHTALAAPEPIRTFWQKRAAATATLLSELGS